jgi:sulfate transport system ATP-binding protein
VTLVHALTVGPNTRLEFKRTDDVGEVDVEVPRNEYAALRDSGILQPGGTVYLKPRRVRRFSDVGQESPKVTQLR